jgi:hypothetical protein
MTIIAHGKPAIIRIFTDFPPLRRPWHLRDFALTRPARIAFGMVRGG